jgi:signal peptidase I
LVEKSDNISANRLVDDGPRKVWLAAVMGIVFPGMGQLYTGQTSLALLIILLVIISHALMSIVSPALPEKLVIFRYGIYILAIIQAIVIAHRQKEEYHAKVTNNWIFYMVVLMVGLILTNLPGQLLYRFYQVDVDCMDRTYDREDVLYISRTHYWFEEPKPDEIVLYRNTRYDGRLSIGRIWSEGEKEIEVRNNAIFLDGNQILTAGIEPVEVPRMELEGSEIVKRDEIKTVTIPEDNYLIIGDNSYGWADAACTEIVPKQLIEGRIEYVYYDSPPERDSLKEISTKLLIYKLFLE